MRKTILFLLTFFSILALIFRFSSQIVDRVFHSNLRSGVRIESNVAAQVTIDSKSAGTTPYKDDNAIAGEHKIALTSDSGTWQGYVTFNQGTLTVINRELAAKESSASGEIITLEKGAGVTLLSQPTGSEVEIDGKDVGATPLSLPTLSAGEHLFLISHQDFLKRSIRAVATDGYKLDLNVDLATDVSASTPVPVATPTPAPGSRVEILETPTGFLRVRSEASLNSSEIYRVAPGDTLDLLDEQTGWYKVQLPNNQTGFVSTSYAKKI